MVRAATLVCLCFALGGCNKAQPYDDGMEILRLTGDLNLAKSRIDSLENQLAEERRSNDVILKRGDEGYAFAKSDIGGLTVQLKGVSDVNGVAQIRLQIGNTSSATITTTQIYASWGQVDKDGNPQEATKSHSVSPIIKQAIAPGTWQTVSFPINGAKASDVGYIRVYSINANSLTLTGQK